MAESFKSFRVTGLAVDPIHVGTGGARLGRVDLSIVRDPVTRVPKIPGSSLAGVYRAYAAMEKGKYPDCAGQGQPDKDGKGGHCCKADCPICTVFGFARGERGGFAGLAAFTDAHVLLFPVATREGPLWVTCPAVLRLVGPEIDATPLTNALYRGGASQPLNLGWILLEVKAMNNWSEIQAALKELKLPQYIVARIGVVSDKLFSHVVNSNLETRTSVSIDPETGAAEDKALFTYEALPRSTILLWDVTCRDPRHFKLSSSNVTVVQTFQNVFEVVSAAHPYLEHLGIGGMGRLRVLSKTNHAASTASQAGGN